MQKHEQTESAELLLDAMLARSESLWGKERTRELRPQIEALIQRLVEVANELPEEAEEPWGRL